MTGPWPRAAGPAASLAGIVLLAASNGRGVGPNISGGIDPSSPQFQAAQKACHMPGA